MPIPVSCVVLAYNEEKNIQRCLEGVNNLVSEIFVVDSYSTDRTLEIAKKFTGKIYQRSFTTNAAQWDWALKNLPFSYQWCLALDADQLVSLKLENELKRLFKNNSLDCEGYYIKRRQIFQGKWIRFGGYYPKYVIRLFKVKGADCDTGELVDNHFYVKGKTKKLKHDIIEENLKENDLSFWIDKHNRYSSLLAEEEISYQREANHKFLKPALSGNPDQAILWLKNFYRRLPLFLRSLVYFLYRYILRLGFLDGKKGLVFHFMQGFWYRMLVDLKIKELKQCRIDMKP